jgi:hypothetical protein
METTFKLLRPLRGAYPWVVLTTALVTWISAGTSSLTHAAFQQPDSPESGSLTTIAAAPSCSEQDRLRLLNPGAACSVDEDPWHPLSQKSERRPASSTGQDASRSN